MDKNLKTEERILLAATQVFMREGYDGARMQQIADEAGMNKALIHYYFRSKERLFERIFIEKKNDFLPRMNALFFSQELNFVEKMELYVENYMQLLQSNPFLPKFLMCNAHKNPDFIEMLPTEFFENVIKYISMEIESGKVRQVDPRQFMLSLLSMCLFPFAAADFIGKMMKMSDEEYKAFIAERTFEIQKYVRLILVI